MIRSACCGLLALLLSGCLGLRSSQESPSPSVPPEPTTSSADNTPYKPYDEVVTDEAETDEGLFGVHRIGEDLFFEIPDSLMGRELLTISRIAQTPTNLSPYINAGSKTAEQVLRWERRGDQVLLRKSSYASVADDALPIAQSVRVNNFEPIVAAFDVEALTPDSAGVVIEVTDLFTTDVPAISGLRNGQRRQFQVRRLDGNRSFIDEAKSFPLNVNVRHTLTFEAAEPPSNAQTGTISMQMYQTMVLLPEEPMMPRLADPRVGYFTVSQVDFGLDEQKAATRTYIRRWRLEPSDPEAYARGELVEPVKPIVYYLDPATPERWRSYFCRGVEDWNEAFEAAGFRDAIRCELPPSPEEDPDFDPEDVRYSTVRYVANTTRNAVGPSVSDPRSGEIIESDIIWYHNHIRSYRNRLLIETGASNPVARSLNIPDELIGETMRQVIAHEIGHALGLPHNMIASSAFPVDSLRSPTFTAQYGVAPSIMDYARQNYIAQPGDGVERFVRKIGPYDRYAIEWGYRRYPEADTPLDEKPMLDRLILAHADDPMYRYSPQRGGAPVDPRQQTEDLGDDPVKASAYAVQNLQRVVPSLVAWTSRPGEPYDDLEELYGELVFQWRRYMRHALAPIGGVREDLKSTDQEGTVYSVVPREAQEEAVAFVAGNVFDTPTWLADADLLRRFEHAGGIERMRAAQVGILNDMLDPARMQRLIEAEVYHADQAYPLLDFMNGVKGAVWAELEAPEPEVDAFRRNLQRGYLERMAYLMTQEASSFRSPFLWSTPVDVSQSDIRPYVRGQLTDLRAQAERAARRTADTPTRYHLQDAIARIDAILEDEET